MTDQVTRRQILGRSAGVLGASWALANATPANAAKQPKAGSPASKRAKPKFKLGMVTYNIAADWDLPTIIKYCKAAGIGAVEFRTTHKHGVEPSLSKAQREEVKAKCADGGLTIWSLGSVCQFHEVDPAAVAKNIEECKRFIELAHDLGAKGVKVRPNGLPKEVSEEKTLDQIGRSLRTCAEAGKSMGIEIWTEVHGNATSEPSRMRKIMDIADHSNLGVTWNSNGTDVKNGSVKESFELLRDKIRSCHINELTNDRTGRYPYRELFSLFNEAGYDRYTLIEIQGLQSKDSGDIVRFLQYYKALWEELATPA